MARSIVRETIVDRRQTPVRWGAVFAGAITAVGMWILLQLLGTGIGLSAIDTEHGDNLRSVGIGTGIWSLIAPLIALFVGAIVGARLAGTQDRRIGALHGVVMWAMTGVLGVFAVISTITAIASGVTRVGETAMTTVATAVEDTAPAPDADATTDMLVPMNDYLREQGKPAITEDQLRATVRGVAARGVHEGQIDRETLVDEIARDMAMARVDAESLANRFADRYEQAVSAAPQKSDDAKDQPKQAGLQAARATGRAMLWGGLAMLVALLAAVAGGAIGVPRVREVAVTTATEPPPSPIP